MGSAQLLLGGAMPVVFTPSRPSMFARVFPAVAWLYSRMVSRKAQRSRSSCGASSSSEFAW